MSLTVAGFSGPLTNKHMRHSKWRKFVVMAINDMVIDSITLDSGETITLADVVIDDDATNDQLDFNVNDAGHTLRLINAGAGDFDFNTDGDIVAASDITSTAGTIETSAGVINIKHATPSLDIYDTSCTDDEVSAQVLAAATDTSTTAEDVDVTLKQKIAGTLTAFLTSDADGDITLGSGRSVVADGGGSLTGTWSDLGDVTTINIDGGSIDGTTLGAASASSAIVTSASIEGAAPTLTFKDTDCTDADANATILAQATDTGTGAEDVDVTFSQQIAGAPTAFLTSDADGNITFGTGRPLVADGGGSLTGTWSDLGAVTTVDINGGTVDNISTLSVESATPSLDLKDSSCTDADVNAQILVAATATGTGAENIDVTITQQISGTPTDAVLFDADGDIAFDSTRTVTTGALTGTAITSTSLPGRIFDSVVSLDETWGIVADNGVACGYVGGMSAEIYTVDTAYKTYRYDYGTGTDTYTDLSNGGTLQEAAEEVGDATVLVCTSQFAAVNFLSSQLATWGANGGLWEYATAADTFATLTFIEDNTDAIDEATGLRAMSQDGVMTFIPPTNWWSGIHTANTGATLAAGYAIRYRITATQLTQPAIAHAGGRGLIPVGITANTGHRYDMAGTLSKLNIHAGTISAANADTKFCVHNITQNTWGAEQTWTKQNRHFYIADIAESITAGDEICVLVTQEDGTTEYAGVSFHMKMVEA